jgi:hypothetical protein
MAKRHLEATLQSHFLRYKEILILLGSRQVGKTTLLQRLFPSAVYWLVDNDPIRKALESYDIHTYQTLPIQAGTPVVIDEIHRLSDPGRAAKILYDQMPGIQLILTGSSSLHIKHKTSESLAGRKIDYFLYPLTFSEYLFQQGITPHLDFDLFQMATQPESLRAPTRLFDVKAILQTVLVYGLYPAMLNHPQDQLYLNNFVDSLIFKDLLDLSLIENRRMAGDLLKLLAHQIGNLINYSELAQQLGADQRTIKRYIDIFEQSFVLFRLYPFSENQRTEIRKAPKVYFYDVGLRNAIIQNYTDLDHRPDKGALFENFMVSECVKNNYYTESGYRLNFWRNNQEAEMDLVLSKNDFLMGLEMKYTKRSHNRAFLNHYPRAQYKLISIENFY